MTGGTGSRPDVGPVRVGIALLALVTAGVHLYLFLVEGFLGNGKMLTIYQLLFVANSLSYLSLAAALILPPLARGRSFVRALLIAIAVASIASYSTPMALVVLPTTSITPRCF